jgi:hypothetical protein
MADSARCRIGRSSFHALRECNNGKGGPKVAAVRVNSSLNSQRLERLQSTYNNLTESQNAISLIVSARMSATALTTFVQSYAASPTEETVTAVHRVASRCAVYWRARRMQMRAVGDRLALGLPLHAPCCGAQRARSVHAVVRTRPATMERRSLDQISLTFSLFPRNTIVRLLRYGDVGNDLAESMGERQRLSIVTKSWTALTAPAPFLRLSAS